MCIKLVNILLPLTILINLYIVLSATSGGISIASLATVIGASVGIASASFSSFFLATGIIKKLLKQHEIKRKSITKLLR